MIAEGWHKHFSLIPSFWQIKGKDSHSVPLMTILMDSAVHCVAFSGDGSCIVSGSCDGCVQVWDALSGVELKVFNSHTGLVQSVAFSSNGTHIVSGSSDESVQVWDALSGVKLKVLNGHTAEIQSVAFSSDSTHCLWIR